MATFYIVFIVSIGLFVVAFLYETWLSLRRLARPQSGREGYVSATWEVTHTLLVFALITLLMTFTQDLVNLASSIFWPAFIAAIALGLRAVVYLYIWYVRRSAVRRNWVDWIFAVSHLVAAVFLVLTAAKALWFISRYHPVANTQFLPIFIPGLVLTAAVCIIPAIVLYRTK